MARSKPSYAELLRRYMKRHHQLVKPRQGWGSLDPSLHLAYSMGRVRNFTDLGTYVDKPGDHGYGPPAMAFDLGHATRFYNKGWAFLKARRLARIYVYHHKALSIEYVIIGHKIWSRTYGWHRFERDSSHMWHMHVSGHYDV